MHAGSPIWFEFGLCLLSRRDDKYWETDDMGE